MQAMLDRPPRGIVWGLTLVLSLACGSSPPVPLTPVDGILIITLDTLRADRLSGYRYPHPTSPSLDRFAADSVVFDWAFAQYPSTLASHLSTFTGLYPQQHGVVQRDLSLSPELPIIAEVLREAGFRTAGYTENGMISPGSGLGRGFEEFIWEHVGPPEGPDRIFDLGLDFLASLQAGERPFVWLHTYAVHTPYEPTDGARERFLRGHPGPTIPVTGEYLTAVNRGLEEADSSDVEALSRLYDGQLHDVDAAFGRFLEGLRERGWHERLAIVVFADHGEEFRDHGRLVHEQVYPETTRVPLIVHHPGLEPRRVDRVVETVDLAPTLAEFAGVDWRPAGAGRSLVPLLSGVGPHDKEIAYAETEIGLHQRSIVRRDRGQLWQLIEHRFPAGKDGVWFPDVGEFDLERQSQDELELISYHSPRRARILVNGQVGAEVGLTPTWSSSALALSRGAHLNRVRIEAAGCQRPVDLGESEDDRCLSFKVRGGDRRRYELYNLSEDPRAERDIVRDEEQIFRRLLADLRSVATDSSDTPPQATDDPEQDRETLRTLGYL